MYFNLAPSREIITPNGTKILLYPNGKSEIYGVARLAKALGYSQFTPDSTLGLAFKGQQFSISYKQINGVSARVAPFNEIVPLLEYFIKLTLQIVPDNDKQALSMDNARMEAQRLIEQLTDKSTDKQPKLIPPKANSRFKGRQSLSRCVATVNLQPYNKLIGIYLFNGERYLFTDEIVATICADGDEFSTRNKFYKAAKQANVYLSDANIDGKLVESKVIPAKDFFTVLQELTKLETPANVKKLETLMREHCDNPYFKSLSPQKEIKKPEPVKPEIYEPTAMSLFDKDVYEAPAPPAINTPDQVIKLAEPLKYDYIIITNDKQKIYFYHDDNNRKFATLNQLYCAIHGAKCQPNSNIVKFFLKRGIHIYRAFVNDRKFYTVDNMANFVLLDEMVKCYPQIANWIKEEEPTRLETELKPGAPVDVPAINSDDEEERLIHRLRELRQAKHARKIADLDKHIASLNDQYQKLETQIQALEEQQDKVSDQIEERKRERADAEEAFNRQQNLFKEIYS